MRKLFPLYVLFIIFIVSSCSNSAKIKKPYTVVFYNVENLFDLVDAPDKNDQEFTPTSSKQWNEERYQKKISDLSKVISSIDTVNLPILIGVAEIENDLVLNDLINDSLLKRANYKMVWQDGPDMRGIECALLYNPFIFKPVKAEFIKVSNQSEPDFTTRDIVYVKGKIGKELFHIFVNHWPSRRGGEEVSGSKRTSTATVLRNKVDEIFALDSKANIIIMGDMNDEPSDSSLFNVLKAIPNSTLPQTNELVNLIYDDYEQGLGSYSYRGDWDAIDNIIVSGALITKEKGLKSKLDNGFIFHKPFMEYINDQGEMSPSRTYGRSYYGGISDHFPVYMILE